MIYLSNKTRLLGTAGLLLFALNAIAQQPQTAQLTFEVDSTYNTALNVLDVRYSPAPGIGLSDVQMQVYEVENRPMTFSVEQPRLFNLILTLNPLAKPNLPQIEWQEKLAQQTIQLFVSPGDSLKIKVSANGQVAFEGKTASSQQFLTTYFSEKIYDYLPKMGYSPNKPQNPQVLKSMDSLQQVRQKVYNQLKENQEFKPSFDAFVQAMLLVEPYTIKRLVTAKESHSGGQYKLSAAQDETLKKITLDNFKLLPDDALLYKGYRDELKQFLIIKVVDKYPLKPTPAGFVLGAQALQYGFQISDELLKDYPRQREYMLTYWVDYATTLTNDDDIAPTLLAEYYRLYPQSDLNKHFAKTLITKSKLKLGEAAPDFTLPDRDNKPVALSSLQGKPVLLIFCYNLRQHELIMKPLEEKYGNRMTFLYVGATPNVSFESWQSIVSESRAGVQQLYANDQETERLKDSYWGTMPYPFVLLDAAGKVARRWIPQEFPDNKTLQKEVNGLMGEK